LRRCPGGFGPQWLFRGEGTPRPGSEFRQVEAKLLPRHHFTCLPQQYCLREVAHWHTASNQVSAGVSRPKRPQRALTQVSCSSAAECLVGPHALAHRHACCDPKLPLEVPPPCGGALGASAPSGSSAGRVRLVPARGFVMLRRSCSQGTTSRVLHNSIVSRALEHRLLHTVSRRPMLSHTRPRGGLPCGM
jgi:hypothetical protein